MTSFKRYLRFAHRWVGLILAPIFLVLLLSGAILAFKPIVHDGARLGTPLSPETLIATLQRLDPASEATRLALNADGTILTFQSPSHPQGVRALSQTGEILPGEGFNLFQWAKKIHEGLALDADALMELAAYAMLALALAGPLMTRPWWRNLPMGWHVAAGWALWPLLVLAPLTGLMMAWHVGQTPHPIDSSSPPPSIVRAIEAASQDKTFAVENLVEARPHKKGGLMLVARGATEQRAVVDGSGRFFPLALPLPKAVHEGTWAGKWSGFLNLLGLAAMGTLLTSGLLARWRRSKRTTKVAS